MEEHEYAKPRKACITFCSLKKKMKRGRKSKTKKNLFPCGRPHQSGTQRMPSNNFWQAREFRMIYSGTRNMCRGGQWLQGTKNKKARKSTQQKVSVPFVAMAIEWNVARTQRFCSSFGKIRQETTITIHDRDKA